MSERAATLAELGSALENGRLRAHIEVMQNPFSSNAITLMNYYLGRFRSLDLISGRGETEG
jgi:hypothetical protein